MELRQLEYFQMISRLGGMTKAAEHLRVAQPSVSVAIRKLEEELGVTLLDRSLKQVALTAEGRVFLAHAEEILGRVKDCVKEMSDYRLLQKGAIRVGIPPTVGAVFFPSVLAGFQKTFPQFELRVVEQGSLAIRTQLEQGELDVGFAIITNVPPHLETVSVTTGQLLVCLAPSHPLGGLGKIPFGVLREQPFILLKEDTYSRRLIMEECRKHQFTPQIAFSSGQIDTILGLVRQKVGISFLFDAVVRRHHDILARPLAEPLLVKIGLVWNKERYLPKAAKAFIDFVASFPPPEL